MKNRGVLIAAAVLTIAGGSACSSENSTRPPPGTLPPGTAQLTIDGTDLPVIQAVHCAPPEQYSTTIKTGDAASGLTAMVSKAAKLTVEFVRIRNLNGFTGDYNRGLGGDATVSLTQNTYRIAGAALGYGPKSPEPTREPFTIQVSC